MKSLSFLEGKYELYDTKCFYKSAFSPQYSTFNSHELNTANFLTLNQ